VKCTEKRCSELSRPRRPTTGGETNGKCSRLVTAPELIESARKGDNDARHLASVDWGDLMRRFRRELERFVAEFREAENLDRSSGELCDLLQRITAHEEALLEFVLRELAGSEGDSLDAVRSALGESHASDRR